MTKQKTTIRWRLERPSGIGAEATFSDTVSEERVRDFLSELLYRGLATRPDENLELSKVEPICVPQVVTKREKTK